MGKRRTTDQEKYETAGCIVAGIWLLLSLAWVGFVVWAVITLINWLVTK